MTDAEELITPDNDWLDEPITQAEIAAAHAAIKESERRVVSMPIPEREAFLREKELRQEDRDR